MTLRARLTLVSAAAVAVAIVLASVFVYVAVRHQLRGQIDDALEARAGQVLLAPFGQRPGFSLDAPVLGGAGGYAQLVSADGPVFRLPGERIPLPIGDARAVATGQRDSYFADVDVLGTHLRVLTTRVGPELALQIARPLDEVDGTLAGLLWLLAGISLGGVGLATAAGLVVTKATLSPVRRLSETAEHVAATRDLTRRIAVLGDDELGRLARSFNAMLAALDESVASQRRLVADASHELRTPLTSLRANVELLERTPELAEDDRQRLLADVRAQFEELTELVGDLVELARGGAGEAEPEPLELDELVADAVERARRYSNGIRFETELEPSRVNAVRPRLERAVANLLDNAVKWSPPDGTVEVSVRDGEVTVRDHGPGIDPEDLPRVFDRFYRSASARGVPGSGLGLAIVRQVAETHGGAATAESLPGGGARLRLKLLPIS